ncbi:MAG: LamG domain-containing protein, partial [Proteobacteria bacterium]|nr:LamG domain-containing protein [Pseudomonadota bacterium]
VVDSAVTAGTSCTSLTGTASFDTTTGVLSWTPDVTVWGSFELKVTGTSGSQSSIKYLAIAVRPNYVASNLIGAWDAQFADSTQSVTGNYLSWKDLSGNSNHGSISNSSNASWSGSGTASSPYALNFNGSGSVDFGTAGSSSTKMMFSGWVNPSNTNSSSESVILGNSGNATGNGFTVRQKPSYRDVVMSLNPVGYWRLGETSGTTAIDLGSGGNNGTYTNGPTLVQAGGLTSDEDKAVSFDGSSQYVSTGYTTALGTSNFTYSLWFKTSTAGTIGGLIGKRVGASGGYRQFSLSMAGDSAANTSGTKLVFNDYDVTNSSLGITTSSYADGNWHHAVLVRNATNTSLYVDGVLQASIASTIPNLTRTDPIFLGNSGDAGAASSSYFPGLLDEVAIFSSALSPAQIALLYYAGTTGKKMDFVIGKSYQGVVLADSPIGYWRMGETSGTTVIDSSGNGMNGTYINSPTLSVAGHITGDSNTAITLNGSTQYATVSHSSTAITGAMSAEAWYRSSNVAIGEQQILSKFPGGDTNYYFGIYQSKVELAVTGNQYKQSTSTLSNNTLYHLVATYDLSNVRFYINGILDATVPLTVTPVSSGSLLNIARYSGGNSYVFGTLDEVGLYNYTLSPTQIANHYNAGIGTYGGTCTSTSGFSSSAWNFISALFDGSAASFYVNGRQECTVSSVPQKLSSASTNLTAGSTSTGAKGWIGYLADLFLYGTNDGSVVATAANIKTNFDATADRYRQNPLGNIVTNGLVLNLDAANAKQGLRPFANGCASTDLNWFDLSVSAFTGVINNFSSCGSAKGWNGDGSATIASAAGPYRLTFNGTNNYVDLGALNPITGNQISACAWINVPTSSNIPQYAAIVSKAADTYSWQLGGDGTSSSNKIAFSGFPSSWSTQAISNTTMNDGNWHYVCGTYDGSIGSANIKLYVDGSLQNTTANRTGNIPSTSDRLGIGAYINSSSVSAGFFSGHIASVALYNIPLTATQITQNCNAHKSRFAGATCN